MMAMNLTIIMIVMVRDSSQTTLLKRTKTFNLEHLDVSILQRVALYVSAVLAVANPVILSSHADFVFKRRKLETRGRH